MFKLAIFFALVAVAFAAPQYLLGSPLVNSLASPYISAYSTYPGLAYNAYSAPAVSIPAPYAYQSGSVVSYAAEPVEQHGYRISY